MNFLNLINWLKSPFKNLIYFLSLFFLLILFKGCDLFDEEHCLYETNESRIWTPDNYPAVAANYGVTFKFERSASINSIYKIENCCPYGALNIKVNIYEKQGIYTKPIKYTIYLYEGIIIKGKKMGEDF